MWKEFLSKDWIPNTMKVKYFQISQNQEHFQQCMWTKGNSKRKGKKTVK